MLALAIAAPLAHAQFVVFETSVDGDVDADDAELFRQAIIGALEADGRATVIDEAEVAEALGDGASCDATPCARAAGTTIVGQVGIRATVYGEAEIYDFTVTVFDLNTGSKLVDEAVGECMFCPTTEAVEEFGFTVQSALSSVDPLPPATSGAGPSTAEVTEPDVVATTEETTPEETGPAFEPGDVSVHFQTAPNSATIRVNGERVGTGRASISAAPQVLRIEVSADGHATHTERLEITPAMVGPILIRTTLAGEARAQRAARSSTAGSADSFNRTAVGGVLIGTGIAGLTGGIILLAIDGTSNCSDGPITACPQVYETTLPGAALTTVGALAAGAGIGILLGGNRGSAETADSGGTRVALEPNRRGGRVIFRTRF